MPEPIYTQPQIEEAWGRYEDYRNQQVLQVLKNGRWECASIGDMGSNQAKYCKRKTVISFPAKYGKRKTIMSFPKYLKKHYG